MNEVTAQKMILLIIYPINGMFKTTQKLIFMKINESNLRFFTHEMEVFRGDHKVSRI